MERDIREQARSADSFDEEGDSTLRLLDGTIPQNTPCSSEKIVRHNGVRLFILIQLFAIACYTAVFVLLGHRLFPSESSLIYCKSVITWCYYNHANESAAPAQSVVEKVKYRFNATLIIESPYTGPPGEATDGAWHSLLDSKTALFCVRVEDWRSKDMNIAVPKSDLSAHSIPIPGRPGYDIAGLGVFHELHCLVRVSHQDLENQFTCCRSVSANTLGLGTISPTWPQRRQGWTGFTQVRPLESVMRKGNLIVVSQITALRSFVRLFSVEQMSHCSLCSGPRGSHSLARTFRRSTSASISMQSTSGPKNGGLMCLRRECSYIPSTAQPTKRENSVRLVEAMIRVRQ